MYEGIQKKRTKNNRETSLCIILFEYIYIYIMYKDKILIKTDRITVLTLIN